LNAADFEFVADFLKRRAGLSFSPEKSHLVESRLKLVARRYGFKNVATLVRELKKLNDNLSTEVIHAMTTHDTSFFRDHAVFTQFREAMLTALFDARAAARRLRIWCAAASTGQEPYSLAMIVDSLPQFAGWDVEILATDLNADLIERAKEGLYGQFEMLRGLPVQMLAKYFRPEGDEWRLSETLRERVQFRVFNLLDSFDALGVFDVIFCRNVLFYFENATREDVLRRLSNSLADDGYLFVGGAETLTAVSDLFLDAGKAPGVHRKVQAGLYVPAVAMA
jgi:chemotaxis protein methyltransferase CheR